MMRIKGKRGVEAETLMQAFGILIAAAVILLLLHVGNSIWKFFANEQDQGTRENFKVFADKIQKLKDRESTEQLYYIQPGYSLYGFNLEQKTYYEGLTGLFAPSSVARPQNCNSRPCLCICDNADCTGKIKDCRAFDEIDYYVAENLERNRGTEFTFKDTNDKQVNARHLAVFGRNIGLIVYNDDWKTRPIGIRREANAIYISNGILPSSRTYTQDFLDRFSSDLQDSACDKLKKCNVMACKKHDLAFTSIQRQTDTLGLAEQELWDLTKTFGTQCTVTLIYPDPSNPIGPHITETDKCSNDEIYTLFENGISIKASQQGTSRDAIYGRTFAKKCIDTLRSVLNNQGWQEKKAN